VDVLPVDVLPVEVLPVVVVVLELPQAARDRLMAAAKSKAVIFFTFIVSPPKNDMGLTINLCSPSPAHSQAGAGDRNI
jgi:hypothetical protein